MLEASPNSVNAHSPAGPGGWRTAEANDRIAAMIPSPGNQRRLIALETSGRIGSVAAGSGPLPGLERNFSSHRRHAVELLPTITTLCEELGWEAASVSELAISAGPGSFTGLRVGFAVARTWSHFLPARVHLVPTLEVIAANLLPQGCENIDLLAMLDAKRGQVYAAICRGVSAEPAIIRTRLGPGVFTPGELLARAGQPFIALGEALGYLPKLADAVEQAGGQVADPALWPARAHWVYRLAWNRLTRQAAGGPAGALPIYVRLPEAEERWQAARQQKGPNAPQR